MAHLIKHFVIFYSPGTFVAEEDAKEISSWDVNEAMEMAHTIRQRYGAIPYGFKFTTRERESEDFDSKETSRSHMYFLGGRIETLAEVEARNDPKEEILRSNMRGNGYDRILVNENSYRSTTPLMKNDVVLNWKPRVKEKAS